jgi:hypothetical protein
MSCAVNDGCSVSNCGTELTSRDVRCLSVPDDSHHQLLIRWRGPRLHATGLPAVLVICLVVLIALVPTGRFAGLWWDCRKGRRAYWLHESGTLYRL